MRWKPNPALWSGPHFSGILYKLAVGMWACLCLRHALFQLLSKCLGMILLWLCPVSLPSVSLLNKTSYTL